MMRHRKYALAFLFAGIMMIFRPRLISAVATEGELIAKGDRLSGPRTGPASVERALALYEAARKMVDAVQKNGKAPLHDP